MINVQLIQSSYSEESKARITTFILEYPRLIHAELLTHRWLSKNAGSSRAIPVASMLEIANEKMYVPDFKYNQSGMQPAEYLSEVDQAEAAAIWEQGARACIKTAMELKRLRVHKQWANRMLEWFTPIKIVATATDWDNFLWLRNDEEAQDEIAEVARQIEHLLTTTQPTVVPKNGAHVPFVHRIVNDETVRYFHPSTHQELSIDEALALSSSICAQMSYRKENDSLEKAFDLQKQFMESRRVHASPYEHQALNNRKGATGMVPRGCGWVSGNLTGWSQYRHLIPNNTCYSLEDARKGELA